MRSAMVHSQLEKIDIDNKDSEALVEENQGLNQCIHQFMLNFIEEISIRYFILLQETQKKNNKVDKDHFAKL